MKVLTETPLEDVGAKPFPTKYITKIIEPPELTLAAALNDEPAGYVLHSWNVIPSKNKLGFVYIVVYQATPPELVPRLNRLAG